MRILAGIALSLIISFARAQPAIITAPDILAIKMPKGATGLAPTDPPLRDLLASATNGTRTVTAVTTA